MDKNIQLKRKHFYNVLCMTIILVGTIALLDVNEKAIKVKEENSVADVYSDEKQKKHSLKAVLYNDNKYASGGKGTGLSTSGANVSGWVEGDTKYLQIDATLHDHNKKGHTIRVELPKEFYIVGDINYKPTGVSEVKFTKNKDISINNGGTTYDVNEKSGTLTYYISPNIGELTIQLGITYDSRFWDKHTNTAITSSGVAPITVSMNYEENVGTYDSKGELSKVKIAKVTSGTGTKRYGFYPMYSFRYDLSETNTKDLELEVLETTQKVETTYLKEGYIELSIPYATDSSGKKQYLTYDYNKVEWVKEFFHGGMNLEVVEKSASKIKVKLSNMMFNTRDMIVLPLTYPEGMKTKDKYVTFKKGHIKIYGTSNNGSSVTMIDEDMDNFEYATSYSEDMEYHIYTDKDLFYYTGKDAASFLGGIYLENKGNLKSGEKTISFSFPKEILVTTINLPCGKDNKDIEIEYTLYDENLNTVSIDGKTSWTVKIANDVYPYEGWVHNTYTTLTRSKLPSEHRKYYFKTIKYKTSGFAADSRIYMHQAEYDNGSAGNFYGYQSKYMKAGTTYNVNFKMESKNKTQIDTKIKKTVSSTQTSSLGIDSAKFDVTRTFAGNDIKLEGSFFVNAYPYGNSQFVDSVRIGLVLPTGVSFTKNNVKLSLQDGTIVGVNSVTSKKASGTNTFWIIEANKKMIGYCSENIKTITNGNRLNFSIVLSTDANIRLTTLSTYNILYGSAANVSNDSYGNYGWTRSKDTYDLNGNGKKNDYVAITNVEQAMECVIEPGKADIELNDSISISGMGSMAGDVAVIKSSTDVISYSMQLKSVADNYATGLEYFIPIPKSSSAIDTKLVTGESGNMFDMSLLGAATETGSAIKSIEYLVKEGVNYTSAVELSDSYWYTASELTSSGYNFSNVTMIKAVLKDGSMTRGMTSTLKINLKTKSSNLSSIKNHRNDWKCSGYYTFKRDGINVGGWISSDGVAARIDDDVIIPIDPGVTGPEEANGRKVYYVYENEKQILRKDKIEFKVETDYEETNLTFKLRGGSASSSDFKLYRGTSRVSGSGGSYNIKPNTTYTIEFDDDYLFNYTSSSIDFELNTLVEYWLWEGKWEYEWQQEGYWDYDSTNDEWDYRYRWVKVPVYKMYKNRYEYDDIQNIKVVKRKVFAEH